MSEPRAVTWDELRALPRPGCRKVKYQSFADAEVALRRMRGRAERFAAGRLPVQAYWHRSCHAWHLTSRAEGLARERKSK